MRAVFAAVMRRPRRRRTRPFFAALQRPPSLRALKVFPRKNKEPAIPACAPICAEKNGWKIFAEGKLFRGSALQKNFFLCGGHFDGHFFNARQIFYSFRAPQTKIRAITRLRQKIPRRHQLPPPSKSQEPSRARLPKSQSSHKRKNALAKRNKKHKRRLTKIPLKFNCPNSPPQTKIRAITRLRQKIPRRRQLPLPHKIARTDAHARLS